jgi:hypothetical protein
LVLREHFGHALGEPAGPGRLRVQQGETCRVGPQRSDEMPRISDLQRHIQILAGETCRVDRQIGIEAEHGSASDLHSRRLERTFRCPLALARLGVAAAHQLRVFARPCRHCARELLVL